MVTEPNESANAIIAEALKSAGVPPRNIDVPPEPKVEPVKEATPSLDGLPKAPVKGMVPGEEEALEPLEPELVPSVPKPGEPTEQPLSKAGIEAAITEASSKFQSLMDKKINQINFQMQQTIGALNQFFQAQEDSSLASLPENEQVLKRVERLEKGTGAKIQIDAKQPVEQQAVQFYQQLANFVDAVGLKVNDGRIDWAPDVSDPQMGFNRFLGSVKKALVEDQTKVIRELKDSGSKVLTNLRKKTGVDKVSTVGPGGAGLPDTSKMTPMQKIEYGYKVQEELSQVTQ